MATRTFIAIELDQNVQVALANKQRELAAVLPAVRWVNPAGIHVTLAFLGNIDADQIDAAIDTTDEAARTVDPFDIVVGGIGFFGGTRAPRVIWGGVHGGTDILASLQGTLTALLQHEGFALDGRPFSPHLTLARLRDPLSPEERARLIEQSQANFEPVGTVHVEHLSVMKSELTREGPRYTPLHISALRRR